MTRRRLVIGLVAILAAAALYFWWTYDPDGAAIEALLGDVRAAAEAGDLEPVLPAFRRDFTFGSGRAGALRHDQLVTVGNAAIEGIESVELRSVRVEVEADFATVRGTLHIEGGDRAMTARPLPLRLELTRDGEDEALYRGWRLYRAGLVRPGE